MAVKVGGIKGRIVAKHKSGPRGYEYSFDPETTGAGTKTRRGLQSRVYSPLEDLLNRNVMVKDGKVVKVL